MRIQALPSLFEQLWSDLEPERSDLARQPAARPALDVVEYDDHWQVSVDLPGTSGESVVVEFADGVLEIRGERSEDCVESGHVRRRERPRGPFLRRLAFGEAADADGIEARHRNGVLCVRVPKARAELPRQVPVSVH